MLGWEFPPVLTGGLGKACYGLCKALSEQVDLTLVLPRSNQEQLSSKFNVIGLNQLFSSPEQAAFIQTPDQDYLNTIHYLDINLEPYLIGHLLTTYPELTIDYFLKSIESGLSSLQKQALFETPENYGPDILTKIAVYTDTVSQLARETEFDLIHAHDWMTFPAALKIQGESHKPLVLHIHSLETDRLGAETIEPEKNLAYRIEQTTMQRADSVISVSEYTRKQITEHYDTKPEKVTPVHNAIEPQPSSSTPVKERKVSKIAQKLVIWMGRVTHQKGPQSLINTVEMLTKFDSTVKFVVAGTGDQLPWLIEESAKRRLSGKIFFTGFLQEDKLALLLSQADAFFMPSASEPFGLAALEAAQMGIPCVISRQSGVAEVLTASLQADHWDVNKLANSLYAVLHYEGLRKELIRESKNQLRSLTWEKAAQQVMLVYGQLTNKNADSLYKVKD